MTFSKKFSTSGEHTVIRLTNTDSDANDPGDGVPVFQIRKMKKVYLKTRNNLNEYSAEKNHKLVKNVKKSFQIKQEIANGGFNLLLTEDGTTVFNEVFVDDYPNEHTNIRVYVTDTFSTAARAVMEDLVITTCRHMIFSQLSIIYSFLRFEHVFPLL